MRLEEFVRQEISYGAKIHFSRGMWWREIKPFYYWPVHLYARAKLGSTSPHRIKAIAGYQYALFEGEEGNAVLPVMTLDDLPSYSLERLPSKKRNQVRRGLRSVLIKPVEDIEEMKKDGLSINVSALERQHWGGGGDRSYYTDSQKWAMSLEKTFSLPGRETWGAYVDGHLVAYLRGCVIDETAYVFSQMSHTGFLALCPNDALVYSWIMHIKETCECRRVVFGLKCAKDSLNEWKEKLGFHVQLLPIYRWINPLLLPVLRYTRYRHYLNPVT